MCLMCCSFHFHKLKLKADCRSSGPEEYSSFFFGSPLDILQSVLLVIRIKGEKNVHLESLASCVHVPVKFEGRQSERTKNEVILRSWLKACSPCEGPYLANDPTASLHDWSQFYVIPSSTRMHVTYLLSLIICKNVFMKKLECLLHHHMTVNQRQATMVRKQKFEIINLKIQLQTLFSAIIFTGFEKKKTTQKKSL